MKDNNSYNLGNQHNISPHALHVTTIQRDSEDKKKYQAIRLIDSGILTKMVTVHTNYINDHFNYCQAKLPLNSKTLGKSQCGLNTIQSSLLYLLRLHTTKNLWSFNFQLRIVII